MIVILFKQRNVVVFGHVIVDIFGQFLKNINKKDMNIMIRPTIHAVSDKMKTPDIR